MLNLVIGILLILGGLWGVTRNWWIFLDVIKMLVFLGLIGFGGVAFLAGLKNLRSGKSGK